MLIVELCNLLGLDSVGCIPTESDKSLIEQVNGEINLALEKGQEQGVYQSVDELVGLRLAADPESHKGLSDCYKRKAFEYIRSNQVLSEQHAARAGLNWRSTSKYHGSYARVRINNSGNKMSNLVALILTELRHLHNNGVKFPEFNIGNESLITRLIAESLVNDNSEALQSVVGNIDNPSHLFCAGQAKLHPPNSVYSARCWHIDGNPDFSKAIIYLDDVVENDGAFQVAPWIGCGERFKADHFSKLSMMIPYEEKIGSIKNKIAKANMGYLRLSDKCFGVYAEKHPLGTYDVIACERFGGALFNGTTTPHCGGGNVRHERPVLQLLLKALK